MSISFLFSPSIKTVFYLFLASWFPFVSIQKDRMPRAELTPNLMSFIAFENSLLLKRNDCSPKYIFRDVLPDTSDVFSYRMILSVIWSFFFYFFFSCEVFYSLSNISLWFHLSIFSWVVTFTPLSSFFILWLFYYALLEFYIVTLWLHVCALSKLDLTKICELFITEPFGHTPSFKQSREWSFLHVSMENMECHIWKLVILLF